jgi:hypothetical protein
VIYNATMIADATIVFDGHVIADATMVFDVITDTTKITDAIMVYDATTIIDATQLRRSEAWATAAKRPHPGSGLKSWGGWSGGAIGGTTRPRSN